jgi:hypothetical protein
LNKSGNIVVELGDEVKAINIPTINPQVNEKIVLAAEKLFIEKKIPRKGKIAVEQVRDALIEGQITIKDLKRFGIKPDDFAQEVFAKSLSSHARELGRWGLLQQKLNKLAKTDRHAKDFTDSLSERKQASEVSSFLWRWRRLDNVRRGLLVSMLSTAMRNFETQVARLGLDVLDQGFQKVLQKMTGNRVTTHPIDAWESLLNTFKSVKPSKRKETKALVNQILDEFPRQKDRLFLHYSSDIVERQGFPEKIVQALNWANRGQEHIIRRSVFMSELNSALKNKGLSLTKIIEKNQVGMIDVSDIRKAVNKSLHVTFADQPKYGTVAHAFVNFINKLPGATLAIPFPRFMVNSLKFFYDFSPLGILKLVSPTQLKAISRGDFSTISKAALGTAMLGTGYQIRKSEYAGEKWYEVQVEGKTIDLRPFNPFAAYLFVGDIIHRAKTKTLHQLKSKDIIMGVLSANLRAGTGLFIVDKLLEGLVGLDDPQKAVQRLKEFGGEVVGGFFTPLQQLKDVFAQFDKEERIVREKRLEKPLLAPTLERIPFASRGLPEAEIPTREGPLTREGPILKQLTGITIKANKNLAEKELDRLGFTRQEVLPSSGVQELDREIAKEMGPLVEKHLIKLLKNKSYKKMSDARKGEFIRQVLIDIRSAARFRALKANKHLREKAKLQRIPRRTRRVLQEIKGEQK